METDSGWCDYSNCGEDVWCTIICPSCNRWNDLEDYEIIGDK